MNSFDDLDLLFQKYVNHARNERRLADNSVITYRNMLAQYAAFVKAGGVKSFLSPQSEELQQFLEGLRNKRNPERRLKPRTLSLHVSVLHLFYRWLALNGHAHQVQIRPVLNLESPKIDRTLEKVLTREQMARLLDAPQRTGRNRHLYRAMLETLYSTACRESELTHMRLNDLDLRACSVRTTVKGGHERVFFLGRYAVGAIMLYLSETRPYLVRKNPGSPWLFLASRGSGNRMARETVYAIVQRFCRQIGIEGNVGPHAIRRSAAVHLMNGADLRSVMEYLGHKSVQATQVYLQLDPTHLIKAHGDYHPHGANGPPPCGTEIGHRQLSDTVQWPEALTQQAEDVIASAPKLQSMSAN